MKTPPIQRLLQAIEWTFEPGQYPNAVIVDKAAVASALHELSQPDAQADLTTLLSELQDVRRKLDLLFDALECSKHFLAEQLFEAVTPFISESMALDDKLYLFPNDTPVLLSIEARSGFRLVLKHKQLRTLWSAYQAYKDSRKCTSKM